MLRIVISLTTVVIYLSLLPHNTVLSSESSPQIISATEVMDSNNPPIVKEISQGSNKRKYLLFDRCDINKKKKIISQEVQLEMQKHEELFHGRKEEFLWIENQIIETCLKSRVQYIPPAVNESREEMNNRQNYLSSCCGCPPEVIHEVEKHATIFISRREDFLRNEYQIIETCLKSGVQYIPPTVNEKKADMKNRRNFLSRCCVCPPEVICEVEKYVTIFISRRDDFLHNECQIIETCLKSGVQYIPPGCW